MEIQRSLWIVHTRYVTLSSVGQYLDSAGVQSLLRKRIGWMALRLGGVLSRSGCVEMLFSFVVLVFTFHNGVFTENGITQHFFHPPSFKDGCFTGNGLLYINFIPHI